MRTVVVGSGAMGGLFGGLLHAAGNDVLLYDIWREHVDAINAHGLVVEHQDGSLIQITVPATTRLEPETVASAELILLETKTYDTAKALAPLQGVVPPETPVLTLQNGIGNYELIQQALPGHELILLGTTAHGSNVISAGRVRRTGIGPTEIGAPGVRDGAEPVCRAIAGVLTGAGIKTTVADDILAALWVKLAANPTINPTSALTGLKNGELLGDPALLDLAGQIVTEQLRVMDAMDVPRLTDDYFAHARYVMEVTWESYSSMLQDVRYRRRTEIESINGAIVRYGGQHGVPTPVNAWVTALVLNRQRDYLEANRGVL